MRKDITVEIIISNYRLFNVNLDSSTLESDIEKDKYILYIKLTEYKRGKKTIRKI